MLCRLRSLLHRRQDLEKVIKNERYLQINMNALKFGSGYTIANKTSIADSCWDGFCLLSHRRGKKDTRYLVVEMSRKSISWGYDVCIPCLRKESRVKASPFCKRLHINTDQPCIFIFGRAFPFWAKKLSLLLYWTRVIHLSFSHRWLGSIGVVLAYQMKRYLDVDWQDT